MDLSRFYDLVAIKFQHNSVTNTQCLLSVIVDELDRAEMKFHNQEVP
jgi:hypothetical protein